jgi:putative ABC transport system permease protein
VIRYYLRGLLAHARGGVLLYALTVAGAALGVAAVLSIQIINASAIGAFEAGLQAVSGDADLAVVARAGTLPERLFAAVLGEPGVAAAWPVYRVDVALAGREGIFLEVVGTDLVAARRLPWREEPRDLGDALARPGWVAVTPALAASMGWRVGDAVAVTSGSRRVSLVIGALVDFQRRSPHASPRLCLMDIAQVQSLLGRPGRLGLIDVQAAPGVEPAALAGRLRARLGPEVHVLTPAERSERAAGLLSAFRLNLTALSLVSLVVGLFLVHESTQAALVRRRSELGVLRALGATRGQVLGLVLGEVLVLGGLGVAIGLPLGYGVAAANVEMVSRTLTNLYLLDAIESLVLPPWLGVLAVAIGLGGAVAGGLWPALDLGRRQPTALLAAFTLHEDARSLARPLFAAGIGLLALAAAWYGALGRAWQPAGFVLGVALLVAIPLVTPLVVERAGRWAPVRGFGLAYSLRSLATRLQTASFAVAALAIAVSMLIGITLLIGSFRRTVEVWIGTTVRADVYVTPRSAGRGAMEATLEPALVEALGRHPAVAVVDRLRRLPATAGARRVAVAGIDMALPRREDRFAMLAGEPGAAVRQARDAGAVLISEPLARKAGLGVGDRLVLAAEAGERAFPIAGVYYDYSTEGGAVVMDLRAMAAAFGPGAVHSVALYLQPGGDPDRVIDALRAATAPAPLVFRSNRRLREEVFTIFDQTFAVTRILQAMSLVIAATGIALTLLVLARERVPELALYRSLGATRRQLFGWFLGKGLAMALLALALGAAGGVALALVLVLVINRAYFGWTIQLHWPWRALAGQVAVILAAAAAASLYPALAASRTPAAELARDDL